MREPAPTDPKAIRFGPFTLLPSERVLRRDSDPVVLGGRALDILTALLEHPGETVSKRELLGRVWPDAAVEEGSLRFQMAALRRALGDGQDGARYIATLAGRGYCFVAPIATAPDRKEPPRPRETPSLPNPLQQMLGRDEDVRAITALLVEARFVTVLGPGGIGKTTVALRIGHDLLESFGGAVRFVDLGPVNDPLLVPSAVASALGLVVQSSDPVASLVSYLHDKRILVVLDSCEHVVNTAASLAEMIVARAPKLHILVTSREKLRVEGETIYHLAPLAIPPNGPEPTAAEALGFPAVQLFVDRVQAGGTEFHLTDAEAPVVADICRKLDGMALAIELAAGRVHAYGLRQTARLLDGQFKLLWHGRRTAVPRHQTLNATLDWSHDLLPERERAVLRRLSVFAGAITLEGAIAVAGHDDPGEASTLDGLVGLVNKSLVTAFSSFGQPRYRLLDTTRAYADAKLRGSGEFEAVARLHAEHFCLFLERISDELASVSSAQAFGQYGDHLGNMRSALEWCFGPTGDVEIGTCLASAAARLFLQLSLLTECHRWTEQALAALPESAHGTRRELRLRASLGQALMFTRGNSEQVRAAFLRALTLAEQLDDVPYQLQLLGSLHILHERMGDFHAALPFAERGLAVAQAHGDKAAVAAAHSFLGISCHLMGDHEAAHRHLLAGLNEAQIRAGLHFGFDNRSRTRISLARSLFLRGFADQAVRMAEETVDEAATLEHPVTLCMALIWAVSVHIWTGDLDRAEAAIERFIAHAERHSLGPYLAVGAGVKGVLAIRRGEIDAGIATVRRVLETLHADRYELLTAQFLGAVAEGLARAGRSGEALEAVEEVIVLVERRGDTFAMPDLLRIKAEALAGQSDRAGAERVLLEALAISRAQGALAWELRVAIRLAGLWAESGRRDEARDLLGLLYGRFTEGFGTADLRAARALLDLLSHDQGGVPNAGALSADSGV